jgi:hypothetical protein
MIDESLNKSGYNYDHWMHSTLAFSVIINLVTYKLFLETSYWNYINIAAAAGSCVIYYTVLFILSLKPLA